ncbi:FAD-dependent oxidoreductase [Marinobacterium sp. D7]|uniref:NAD(P)/FAD-dependent oxidoreductase n=1 Tax=Marinobacterium ramblicola TaxID=2849041 RepID=UPI001C2CCBA5|nr:FAD-dependent oxidoreductase [Marinobacterium ramblicola]MBV1789233.1 FAD-dependent oxidoreductase [Marinobacterium ramblicola]
MSDAGIVIVGSGHAGLSTAETLRRRGYPGRVRLVGDEAGLPYQRPPLSKQFLKGEWDETRLIQRNAEFYVKHDIELIQGHRVIGVDPDHYSLELDSGEQLTWDKLVLTTGSRLKRLPVPGEGAEGVYYLRTLAQAKALRAALTDVTRVVVIGGGFIGLEATAAFVDAGKQVCVLNGADTLLPRAASALVARYMASLHQARGVQIENGIAVAAINAHNGRVLDVALQDGRTFPADIVLVGIGVEPDATLAEAAGLKCKDGVLIDELCRTSAPDILAAGDCARFRHPLYHRLVRLESIQNAIEQGKHVAATLLGDSEPYAAVPWFWSDQYDTKLQIAGLADGHDLEVIRGDEQGGSFSVFCYARRRLLAVESINAPADHMISRRLIQSAISPTADDAANPNFNLRDLL